MISSSKIEQIHNSKEVQGFLDLTNFYNINHKKGIGVSLDEQENFMLKYYVEIKEKDNEFQYTDFINDKEKIFYKLLPFVDFSRHSSLAIGLKVNTNGEIFKYIHFKFRDLVLKNKSYKFKFANFEKCRYGYSLEYNKTFTKKKRYFYFHDNNNKEYIKKIYGLAVDTKGVSHYETYQTKDNVKINIVFDIFKNKQITKDFLAKNNFAKFENNINAFNLFFKKSPLYFGFDKEDNISFYYNFNETLDNITI